MQLPLAPLIEILYLLAVHRIVEHPNQEGDTCICERTYGLMAESVYGGDIQSRQLLESRYLSTYDTVEPCKTGLKALTHSSYTRIRNTMWCGGQPPCHKATCVLYLPYLFSWWIVVACLTGG